ncbi:bifunctional AP-4-A phosphorylase/ADP sulfurylase [Coemansia sp. RSA 1722]|nr:bifunctional AP-4-A phosphorylase/ADP sulfurylase [Coemansia sp. RSA 485]KAJ2598418.1 bifunctional AP-4-A phosphorylase/ADP sulfurylase [Coemansia sp. RSA 1721]KAJ2599495.1 bifunctional AP-4-A phosphorylase/ADP sulfurylase [Coemansia sp. RSA 1722]
MAKTQLDSLVSARYAQAVAEGALLFTESTVSLRPEQGVEFEVRYVPALAKKPSSKPKEKQMSNGFVNPFLPYDPRLHVKCLGNSHQLLMNKYCVVPHHLLITTAEFRQQGEPLNESDFAAVLETTSGLSRPQIVFYNSGEESGASQPHKHLQVLPMPEYFTAPPSERIWRRSHPEPSSVFVSGNLPFAHFGISIDTNSSTSADIATAYSAALTHLTAVYGNDASYNMIMTPTALMLFPRKLSSWQGISINSLGFAGLVLCKTTEELDMVNNTGVLTILSNVGYPLPPDFTDNSH